MVAGVGGGCAEQRQGLHLHGHKVFCIGLVVPISVPVQIWLIAMSWF